MSFVVRTQVETTLTWDYEASDPRLVTLYERAKNAQWKISDVDWTLPVPFGGPLPDDSAFAMAAFAASPLAPRGRRAWDVFRWEFQSWMVSQFLHGEQAAMVVAARLVETVPDLDSKFYAATQAVDEARHVEAFARYLREKIPHPYEVSPPLRALLSDILSDARWDVTALGMQIMVEAIALAAFRLSNNSFHDQLIKDITHLVARDEARHVTFGVLALGGLYDQMTTAERAEREELVLDAAALIRQRFLLDDIWQRLEVERSEGIEFAQSHELMIKYRQAVFSRVAVALNQIGLMTPAVRDGLDKLGLLQFAGERLRIGKGR